MKRSKLILVLTSILVISILANMFLTGWIISITPNNYDQTYNWNQIINDDSISSAHVFYLYLGSTKQKKEFLEDNEFLLGDRIDYCNIVMLKKKPEDLEVEPTKIEIISPSGLTYPENYPEIFKQTTNENSFTAGKLSKYGERAIAKFNESGLWSIRIEFEHEGTPIGFRYCGTYSKDFDCDSKITVFNSDINVNVYTTSEYAQLRAARASETSALWSTISTYVLIIATVIAVGTLAYYLWSFKKQREISYAQQNRIEIYEPLYNEITEINKKLIKFECPFNANSALEEWKNLKPSVRIRVPEYVEDEIKKFDELGNKFFELHTASFGILNEKINTVINGYAIKDAPRGIQNAHTNAIRNNLNIKKRQLLEQHHGDFFIGEIPSNMKKSVLKELRSYLKNNKKYTEEHVFNRILSQIENNQTILDLRGMHTELIYQEKKLEGSLKEKINNILNNFESKLEEI